MPLLSRHKALGGGGGGASSSSTATSASQQGQQQQQGRAVCESPLFGVRRQFPVGSPAGSGGGGARTPTSGQQAGASIGASATGAATGAAATHGELSSVPQQITRQQIHYAFSIMDVNKDGMIELRELSQMLANLGVPIDEAILAHIMLSVSKRGE